MQELLAQLWSLLSIPFSDPRIAAAVPAFALSWLMGNRNTALACAVVAFCTIKLIIWATGVPYDGAYQLPVEGASGVGAGMALMGVHVMQDRVQSLDVNTVARAIVNAIKGRPRK